MAEAQIVRQTSLTGPIVAVSPATTNCLPISTVTTTSLVFDPQTSGAAWDSWKIEGDFTPVSNTATSLQFRASGYGKIRVTVGYYIVTSFGTGTVPCGTGTVTYTYPIRTYYTKVYDFYKSFPTWPDNLGGAANTSPMTIAGTTCVPTGSSVVYSIYPIVSGGNLLAQNIGFDAYKWAVYPASGGTALPFTYAAGDNSAITFTAPAGGFKVRLVAGNCNGPVGLSYSAGLGAAEKELLVTTGPSLPTSANFPSCVLTNVTTLPTFQLNNLTGGAQYSIQTTLGNVSIPSLTPGGLFTVPIGVTTQQVSIIGLNGNAGDVFVTPIGGCNATPLRLSLTRTLVTPTPLPAPNTLPALGYQTLTSPGCQAAMPVPQTSPVTVPPPFPLTLNNAPGSTTGYTWTLPYANWIASGIVPGNTVARVGTTNVWTSTQPTITIQRPSNDLGGTVSVNVTGCPSGTNVVERAINVTGLPGTCATGDYVITRNKTGANLPSPYNFSIDPVVGSTCTLPTGFQVYAWSVMDATNTNPDPAWTGTGAPSGITYTFTPSVSFYSPTVSSVPTRFIRVTISDPSSCFYLFEKKSLIAIRPAPGGSGDPKTAVPTAPAAARGTSAALNQMLKLYPNPAGNTLQVELPEGNVAALTLFDPLGRVVRQVDAAPARTTLDVKELPTGTYTLRVIAAGATSHRVVQVQH